MLRPNAISVVSVPAVEPVSLQEAKFYLHVSDTASDDLISSMIVAARVWCETKTRRAFVTQTIEQRFDRWPVRGCGYILTKAPVASISTVYLDTNEAEQTLDGALLTLSTASGPAAGRATVEPVSSFAFPLLSLNSIDPVRVRAVCGYGNAAAVPAGIKAAIQLMVADMFEQRSESVDGRLSTARLTIDRLLSPYCLPEAV